MKKVSKLRTKKAVAFVSVKGKIYQVAISPKDLINLLSYHGYPIPVLDKEFDTISF